jgi:hypothetical protein
MYIVMRNNVTNVILSEWRVIWLDSFVRIVVSQCRVDIRFSIYHDIFTSKIIGTFIFALKTRIFDDKKLGHLIINIYD